MGLAEDSNSRDNLLDRQTLVTPPPAQRRHPPDGILPGRTRSARRHRGGLVRSELQAAAAPGERQQRGRAGGERDLQLFPRAHEQGRRRPARGPEHRDLVLGLVLDRQPGPGRPSTGTGASGITDVDRSVYQPTRDNWGPLVIPEERYFMLGDNREYSLDSRYWGRLPD